MVEMTRLQFAGSASNVTGSSADVRRSVYQNTTSELWTNTIPGDNFDYVKYIGLLPKCSPAVWAPNLHPNASAPDNDRS